MSSELSFVLSLAGIGTIALGIWHIGVPYWFDYRTALAGPGPSLGTYRVGPVAYERRREDLLGIAWVMSNAASFVLVSIGLLDLAWSLGDRTVPTGIGGAWIAAWWLLRAAGQLVVGRRRLDGFVLAVFILLGAVHLALALAA